MDGDCVDPGDGAKRDATVPSELPAEVQRVAPAAPPPSITPAPASSTGGFANVQLRPEGQRYGDADLVPGGSLEGSGGVLMNERNFPRLGGETTGMQENPYGMPGGGGGGGGGRGWGGQPRFGDSADGYARFVPLLPGQMPPGGRRGGFFGGGGRGGFGSAPRLPGEPDDDNFFPPGGRPGETFGGPGGGQFGPGQSGFGGWGGQSGSNSRWA
jgi:hypothetical protein